MRLKYCSITGADDNVDIADLHALEKDFPFVEWAILWLPGQQGRPRCSGTDWIEKFAGGASPNKALHLCDTGLLDFIEGDAETLALMQPFSRIQLNLEFGAMGDRLNQSALLDRVRDNPQWEFIIQYTDRNKQILPRLKMIPNHALLFDTSAGRGVSPDSWPAPVPGHFCGYAGGINPANVQKNLDMIADVAKDQTTWIDMESGIRTDDRFDLRKVLRILEIASPYASDGGKHD